MSFDHTAPPPDFQYGPIRPRKKSKLPWILLLVIPLGLLALIVFVVGMGAVYVLTAAEEEVTAEDRQLVVDIQALAGLMEDFVPDLSNETITKRRYFDRSYDIEYEYDDPNDDDEPYLYCCVTVERKHSDAITSYVAAWQTSRLGMAWGADAEVEVVERNDLFQWGDQSRFAIVKADGEPCGNLFVARKGKTVIDVMVGGVYFDEPEGFSGFVSPALSKIEKHRPRYRP
jgi:hypothetical protein